MSYKSSPFKMAPKSPAMKALKGEQVNLPEGLKKAIEASPAKQVSLGKAFSGTKHKLMNPKDHRDPHTDALRAFKQGDPEPMKNENARKKAIFIAKGENSAKAQAYTSRANKFGVKKPKLNK